MPTKGYDVFFREPSAHEQMACRVCGSLCQVERSRIGPTGSVEAMGGLERPHYLFVCPHADEPWHNQALGVLRKAETEPDPLLAAAFRERLRELVAARGG